MRKIDLIVWCVIAASLSTSCATPALWKKTDPSKYILVSSDVISEKELRQKGVKYIKNEQGNGFFVEQSNYDKLKDYTYRVLGTPIAVAIDAAIVALVVGVIAADPASFLRKVAEPADSRPTNDQKHAESSAETKKDNAAILKDSTP